jgi:hypothetical protein
MGEGNEVTTGTRRDTYWSVYRALASILIGMLPAVVPYGGRVNRVEEFVARANPIGGRT